MSAHSCASSHNTVTPSFQLDIGQLLCELPEDDREEEANQASLFL